MILFFRARVFVVQNQRNHDDGSCLVAESFSCEPFLG